MENIDDEKLSAVSVEAFSFELVSVYFWTVVTEHSANSQYVNWNHTIYNNLT